MNKARIPLIAIAALAIVGIALQLWGVFESDTGSPDPVVATDSGGSRQQPPIDGPAGQPDGPAQPLTSSRFTSAHDTGATTGRLAGPVTGLAARGIIMDPAGAPLGDARVALVRDLSQIKSRFQEGEILLELVTDNDGVFLFENLVRGDVYVLKAGHVDYTTERRHPVDPMAPGTLTQNIKLQQGTFVAGKVMDASGGPLGGATVSVFDTNVASVDPLAEPERTAVSEPDGSYHVQHLTHGLKRIFVRKDGYSTDGRNNLNLREDGGIRNVDFTLTNGFEIHGMVKDARSGDPVAGAAITARMVSLLSPRQAPQGPGGQDRTGGGDVGEDGGDAGPDHARRTTPGRQPSVNRRRFNQKNFLTETAISSEDGTFVIEGLVKARYMLTCQAKGFQNRHGTPATAGTDGTVIDMTPSARVIGRVVDDVTGAPVTNFTVATSTAPNPMFIPYRSRQHFESEDGSFLYVDVPPGKHYLIASADGYAGGASEPIVVAAEQEVTGIELRLAAGATLIGVVRHKDGPIRGARVSLGQPSSGDPTADIFKRLIGNQMRTSSSKTATTDAQGRWSMAHVPAGSYSIKVEHRNYTKAEAGPLSCENQGEVHAPDVILTQGGIIKGVVHLEDGKPDSKATVMISSEQLGIDANRSIQTDGQGRFEARGLTPGTYRVVVAQRNGEFDLLKILQSRQDPGNLVQLTDGQTLEIQL